MKVQFVDGAKVLREIDCGPSLPIPLKDTVQIRTHESPILAWPRETPIKSTEYRVLERKWIFDDYKGQELVQVQLEQI